MFHVRRESLVTAPSAAPFAAPINANMPVGIHSSCYQIDPARPNIQVRDRDPLLHPPRPRDRRAWLIFFFSVWLCDHVLYCAVLRECAAPPNVYLTLTLLYLLQSRRRQALTHSIFLRLFHLRQARPRPIHTHPYP